MQALAHRTRVGSSQLRAPTAFNQYVVISKPSLGLPRPLRAACSRPVAARVNDAGVAPEQHRQGAVRGFPGQLQTKMTQAVKTAAKVAAICGVALALILGRPDAAHAARSAGRAGGFHSPAPSMGMSRGYSGGAYSGGYSMGGSWGGSSMYSMPYTYRAPVVVPGPSIGLYSSPGVVVTPGATAVSTGSSVAVELAFVTIALMFFAASSAASRTALSKQGGFLDGGDGSLSGGGRPTLTRVQVGLVSLARELKHDLDRIAAKADTTGSRGLHMLLQEVALALLRNPSYCVYGDVSQKTCGSMSSLESTYNSASLKERSKFEQETLVNVSGVDKRNSRYSHQNDKQPDELIVVTLLVATACGVQLPSRIDSLMSMKQALQSLGALRQSDVVGVELLWTPQAEGDYYTKDEMITEYPNLRQL